MPETPKPINIKELKARLASFPDDAEVFVDDEKGLVLSLGANLWCITILAWPGLPGKLTEPE
jgi:hypothetical protein